MGYSYFFIYFLFQMIYYINLEDNKSWSSLEGSFTMSFLATELLYDDLISVLSDTAALKALFYIRYLRCGDLRPQLHSLLSILHRRMVNVLVHKIYGVHYWKNLEFRYDMSIIEKCRVHCRVQCAQYMCIIGEKIILLLPVYSWYASYFIMVSNNEKPRMSLWWIQ